MPAAECISDFCPVDDDVCCDAACAGVCVGCAGGTCTDHAAYADPDNDCLNAGESCDGNGACKLEDGEACTDNADCISDDCQTTCQAP